MFAGIQFKYLVLQSYTLEKIFELKYNFYLLFFNLGVKLGLSSLLPSFRPRLRELEKEQQSKLHEPKTEGVCQEDRQNCKKRNL
jgi:hypothetical protein